MKHILLIGLMLTLSLTSNGQRNENLPLGDYTELTDTKPINEKAWNLVPEKPQLSWGNTDTRYSKQNVPSIKVSSKLRVKGWKGERINAQAILWTTSDLEKVSIAVSDLSGGKSVIPASAIQTNFVRYVMTDEVNKDGSGACGHRPIKSEWDSSIVADVLDVIKIKDVKARTTQPFWINVWIPAETNSGIYKGTVSVSFNNSKPLKLQLEIEVLNHTLPAPKDWAFHLDLWQNPYSVARYHQVPLWSKAHFEALLPVMKTLANAGQKVITTSIMHKPWNGQTEDHFDSMIFRMKKMDGTWEFRYDVFDKWVNFMMNEVGIDEQINCYTLIPWALRFDYFDEATNRVMFVEAKPGEAAYEAYWGSFLKDFARHLKEKGWFEKTTIAMDERGLDVMQEALKVIKNADPDFKVSLAGNYHPEIEADLYDLCLAFGHNFPDGVKARREKEGKISTVYTCCAEALPNTFTFSPPAEATWIGWHAMAGNYDGYLRWAYNSWTSDPLRDSRFRSWAAGDCYIVYPGGRSSIRMERLVEGIQDYEKIRMLKEEFIKKNEKAKLDKLNKIVSSFTPEGLTKTDPAKMVTDARNALNRF